MRQYDAPNQVYVGLPFDLGCSSTMAYHQYSHNMHIQHTLADWRETAEVGEEFSPKFISVGCLTGRHLLWMEAHSVCTAGGRGIPLEKPSNPSSGGKRGNWQLLAPFQLHCCMLEPRDTPAN